MTNSATKKIIKAFSTGQPIKESAIKITLRMNLDNVKISAKYLI